MKNKLLVITLSIMLFSCNNNQAQQKAAVIENVDAKRFKELVDEGKGIILDVRTPEEVAGGYINNASTININDADFEAKINLMQKDKAIYVYCRSGGRSSRAAAILEKNGFTKVYNLTGGIAAWEQSGYPLVKPDGAVDEKIQQMTIADFNKILDTKMPVLVDFHTKWCSPCKKMAPIVDGIEATYKGKAVVIRIDVDQSKDLAKQYKIQGVPVFILFKNGTEKWKQVGATTEDVLIKKIEENL